MSLVLFGFMFGWSSGKELPRACQPLPRMAGKQRTRTRRPKPGEWDGTGARQKGIYRFSLVSLSHAAFCRRASLQESHWQERGCAETLVMTCLPHPIDP